MFWSFTGNFHLLKSRPDEWLRMFVELGGKPEENDVYCYKIRSPLWNNKRVNFNPGLKVYEKWSWVIFVCMAASTTARDSWYVLLAPIFNMGGLKWLYLYTFIQTCSCFWHPFGRYHLKMDGWKTMFLLGWLPCRCNVSVREETTSKKESGFLLAQNGEDPNLKCQFSTGKTTGFILKICFFFFFFFGRATYFIPWKRRPWAVYPDLPQSCLSSIIWTLGGLCDISVKTLEIQYETNHVGFHQGISDSQMFHTYINYGFLLIQNISAVYTLEVQSPNFAPW